MTEKNSFTLKKTWSKKKLKLKSKLFSIYLLAFVILMSRLHFCLVVEILNLIVNLAIKRIILIEKKVTISFLRYFL